MKHWSGLVYLAVGIAVGLIVGASVSGFSADEGTDLEKANEPGRYSITAVAIDERGYGVFMLDTRTGRARCEFKTGIPAGHKEAWKWEPKF